MDYIELRKRTVFKRYHDSDIFNLKNDSKFNKSSNPSKNRTTQGSLEKTKNDLFNTLENQKTMKAKPHKKKISFLFIPYLCELPSIVTEGKKTKKLS